MDFLRPSKTLHSCTESKPEGKDLTCKVTVGRVQICLKTSYISVLSHSAFKKKLFVLALTSSYLVYEIHVFGKYSSKFTKAFSSFLSSPFQSCKQTLLKALTNLEI